MLRYLKYWLLLGGIVLCLPLLLNDTPLLIIHPNGVFFPVAQHYTEATFGGESTLLMDYSAAETKSLLSSSMIIKAPYPYGMKPVLPIHVQSAPSRLHPLGTNTNGQDILALSIYALCQNSFMALTLTLLSAGIGTIIGVWSGIKGGWVRRWNQVLMEIVRSMPLALVIVISHQKTSWFIGLFCLTQWSRYAQLVGQHTTELINTTYVTDALQSGQSIGMITKVHLMPHLLNRWEKQLPYTFASYLALLQGLAYFGVWVGDQYPQLGMIAQQTKQHPQGLGILLIIGFCFIASQRLATYIFR